MAAARSAPAPSAAIGISTACSWCAALSVSAPSPPRVASPQTATSSILRAVGHQDLAGRVGDGPTSARSARPTVPSRSSPTDRSDTRDLGVAGSPAAAAAKPMNLLLLVGACWPCLTGLPSASQ